MKEDAKNTDDDNRKKETNAQCLNIPHRKVDGTVTLATALCNNVYSAAADDENNDYDDD